MSIFDQGTCTNAQAKPTKLSRQYLDRMMELLKGAPTVEEMINHANMGKDYLEEIKRSTRMPPGPRSELHDYGFMGAFCGFNIYLDEDLPPDVCEFRNKDSKVLYALTLGKGNPTNNTSDKEG
jgi:hypothetical protein